MLTVAKITQRSGAGYAAYLDGRTQSTATGDYYLRDGDRVEAPGRWVAGSSAFGIEESAAISGEQLRALLDIRRPDTGEPLRPVGANGTAVAALDATFSAPKSVSAAWAVADLELRGRIEAAHEAAIDRTLTYAVDQVAMIRERVSREQVIHTAPAGVVATSWRHSTARAVEGQPPDPQLHSHVLLHAAVRDDGRLMAIDSRAWLVHRRELGAAYRTELARELRGLGFDIQRGTGRAQRYFEIGGVPAELTERWSQRDRQIRAAIDARVREQADRLAEEAAAGGEAGADSAQRLQRLRESGLTPAQNRAITVTTRAPKPHAVATHRDLDAVWSSTASELGFDAATLDHLREERAALPPAATDTVVRRLTEFDATFTDHAARAVALEASAGSPIDEGLAVLDHARARGELVGLEGGRLTTRAHRTTERATRHAIHQVTGSRTAAVPEPLVDREITWLQHQLSRQGGTLTDEQADAIRLACGERQLTVIEGQAGTGKSTVLGAVARAHQADGRQILVTSTAALAAQRLGDDLEAVGVSASVSSTASLHAALTSGRAELSAETTVIHDEAALASTREQHRLMTAIQASGARLIEVGDPEQSRPVGAAGLWSSIEADAQANDARAELTHNVRARDPDDVRDQQHFRDGDIKQALNGYSRRGRLLQGEDPRRIEDAALYAAEADRQVGRHALVIAQTSNEHLDALNARAQAIRHDAGQRGDDAIPVPGRPYQLRAGDPVQIRRTFTHPDRAAPVRNGTAGQVVDVDADAGEVELQVDHGDVLRLDRDQLAAADARLAYVQHPFPAQGHTTDTTHFIVAEHATREGSYVALTRARDRTDIYASHDEPSDLYGPEAVVALTDRLSRTEPDVPSIDYPLAHENAIDASPDQIADAAPGQRGSDAAPDTAPRHLTAALGPRPEPDDASHDAWQQTADAIEDYRSRYAIPTEEPTALGPVPPPGRFRQRHDHARASAQVADGRRELGIEPPDLAADIDRDAERDRRERGAGYEP